MHPIKQYLPILFALTLLGGCASAPDQDNGGNKVLGKDGDEAPREDGDEAPDPGETNGDGGGSDEGNGSRLAAIDLTRFINIQNHVTSKSGSGLSGYYTRVVINGKAYNKSYSPDDDQPNSAEYLIDYEAQKRTFLGRLLAGKSLSTTLVAKLSEKTSDVQATVPLLSITHDSNSESGESFVTAFTQKAIRSPYFRINPASVLRMKISLSDSEHTSADFVGAIFNATQAVADAAFANTVLATTLNEDSARRTADAVEAVVGQLLSENIKEEYEIDEPVPYWNYGDSGAETGVAVTFFVPDRLDPDDTDNRRKSGGEWNIRLDDPRPSVFTDHALCVDATKDEQCVDPDTLTIKEQGTEIAGNRKFLHDLSPAEVLSFQLAENQGVGSYIQSKTWFNDLLTGLRTGKAGNGGATIRLCRRVRESLHAVGLNKIDAHVGVWAIDNSANLSGVELGDYCTDSAQKWNKFGLEEGAGAGIVLERFLRRGCQGRDVLAVQRKLSASGYDVADDQREYGDATRSTVRAFQEAEGLEVDGIVGKITANALGLSVADKLERDCGSSG